MKFGFVTCVQLGLGCMEEIYRVGGQLDLAVTLKDDLARGKSGRVYLDAFCAAHQIPLLKIRSVNDAEVAEAVRGQGLDWLFIIGWSQIARPQVLAAPRRGVLGIHPTLLPEGRGRAPIPWAILKGLSRTGVTLFKLDEGVDTGPILAQEVLSIAPDETATTLYERVEEAHRTLLGRVWPGLLADRLQLQPQDESRATVWPRRTPVDGAIAAHMSCTFVDRLVRATTHPYPGAFVDYDQSRYRIWSGVAHSGRHLPSPVELDTQGRLWVSLCDGCYEATVWEVELVGAAAH